MRTGARTFVLALSLVAAAGCKGNRDQLLADLQSPRPEVRALAVKKLAEQDNPEDLVLFTRAAKDLASIVRAEAADALGASQDSRVVDLLGELLEDSDETVQGHAAMALSRVKGDKAKAYLTLQYGRRGRATRQVIVQALKAANVPGAMAEVVAAEAKGKWERNLLTLTEGSLAERVGAAEELGRSGRPEAVNRLLELSRDSQVILASAAVRGLGDAGDKRAVGPIALLLNESFPELREAAITSLMKLQDPSVAPRLQAVALEKSVASRFATDALLALPRAPQTDAALCAILVDGAKDEALSSGLSLRGRGGCPLEPIVERFTRPVSMASGLQAVIGLGPLAQAALPKVLPLLASPDAALRLQAVEAVAAIGDASAAPALLKLYEQELKTVQALREDWIRQPLPEQYGAGFDPSAPPPPSENDTHVDVSAPRVAKQTALFDRIRALNAARAREAGRVVIQPRVPAELVDDVSPAKLELLASVLKAIGAVKAPGAVDLLKGFAGDSSVTLRAAALAALASLGPEGVELARAGMFEAERDLQKALAQALAAQGEAGQSALVALLPQLGAEKLVALDALAHTGVPPSASAALQEVVRDGGAEAVLAANLLGSIQAKDAVATLTKTLDDPSMVARRDVLLALGEIGDKQAAEIVARDLYHDLPEIRAAAATALMKLGTPAQAEALDALKSDYYRRVREAAGEAHGKTAGGTASEGAR
ncbi:HEAT repeat domain-containing protein [Myxococcaceae bacterium GXIMD 01537]